LKKKQLVANIAVGLPLEILTTKALRKEASLNHQVINLSINMLQYLCKHIYKIGSTYSELKL